VTTSHYGSPYSLYRINAAGGSAISITNLGGTGYFDNGPVNPSPAVANGRIYVSINGSSSGQLLAFQPNGSNLTALSTVNLDSTSVPTSPLVANGVLYVDSGFAGGLVAIDAETGSTIWSGSTAY